MRTLLSIALLAVLGGCEHWPDKAEVRRGVESDAFRQLQASVPSVALVSGQTTCLSVGDNEGPGNAAAVPDSATFRLMRSVGLRKLCINNESRSVDYIWQSDWEDQTGVYHPAPGASVGYLGDKTEEWENGLIYYSTF